jgi:hypothetical protein
MIRIGIVLISEEGTTMRSSIAIEYVSRRRRDDREYEPWVQGRSKR